ncbi:MAG: YbaB/EbfC family nucleoid-associated protein [Clostridiaceae bacterium]|nr:YbaB/EbfC family nucleoid-associated protein [Clostridiaceae bacterium]
MAKRRGGFQGGGGGAPNMNQLMQQAQKMQRDLEQAQSEAANITSEASVGGGMIEVKVDSNHQIVDLKIDPAVIDPEDPEMLVDLFTAAVNEANRTLDEKVEATMSKVTGNSNLGMFGL